MLTAPMRMLGMALGMAQRAVASGARVFELLDRDAQLTAARRSRAAARRRRSRGAAGRDLRLRRRRAVLRDVDLDVEAGRTVALVGPTGSGKTTLVMLVPRLYDVREGAVLVDGVDVRDLDPAVAPARGRGGVRRRLPVLRHARDNIAYARPDASEEEIEAAAARAGLDELIDQLPDGFDTLVGERGLTLSGGQRQRVAIARALLAEPRILILDDATSSVDATTEAASRTRSPRSWRGAPRS